MNTVSLPVFNIL